MSQCSAAAPHIAEKPRDLRCGAGSPGGGSMGRWLDGCLCHLAGVNSLFI